jgi:hypothetical protein
MKLTDEKLKEMKNATCVYPVRDDEGNIKNCGEPQMATAGIPALYVTESGKIEAFEGMQLSYPFCEYHLPLIMTGQFGIMMKDGKPMGFHGPMEPVEIIESVITAFIVSGKLQKMIAEVEKGSKDAEKMMKEIEAKEEANAKGQQEDS